MIKAHFNDRSSVSVWAAIGAPLLGVPLMVALLAVAAPRDQLSVEVDAPIKTEQLDVQEVEVPIEIENVEEPLRRG